MTELYDDCNFKNNKLDGSKVKFYELDEVGQNARLNNCSEWLKMLKQALDGPPPLYPLGYKKIKNEALESNYRDGKGY